MARKYSEMHLHLRRLDRVWLDPAIFFVTACTRNRKAILASEQVAEILIEEWQNAQRHGWHLGRYVIMPDHVHLFLRSRSQRRVIIGFCGSMETLEQSANFQNAADSVHGYRRDLAAGIFRSSVAFRRKLRPKMELCSR